MADKPAILADSRFVVEEGLAYRAMRTGAIWMNKLFFSCLVLLGVWLLLGLATGNQGCVGGVPNAPHDVAQGPVQDAGSGTHCSVFLSPTSEYLGAMAGLSFVLSLAFGILGLVVGKRILAATPAAQEVGAQRSDASAAAGSVPSAGVPPPPSNP